MGPSQLGDLQISHSCRGSRPNHGRDRDLAHGISLAAFMEVDSLRKCLQDDCGDKGSGASHFTDY